MREHIKIVASLNPGDVDPHHVSDLQEIIVKVIGDHDGVYDVARCIAEQAQVSLYYDQPLTRNILSHQTLELSHYVDDVEITEETNNAVLDAVCAYYGV